MVNMIPVSSSNIASVGHDSNTGDLYVDFLNGDTYVYSGVPAEVFEAFANSSSPGRFLHSNIKNQYLVVQG